MVIFVQNATSTIGGGLTGLTASSSGLSWYYFKSSATVSALVSIVASANIGTYTAGGWKEIDATNLPGFYELGVPDSCFNGGANWVVMEIMGAANMVPVTVEFELTGFDPTNGTNLALTAIPAVTYASVGGLPVVGVNAVGNINLSSGNVIVATNSDKTGYSLSQAFPTNFSSLDISTSGYVDVGKWLGTAVTSAAGVPITTNTGTVTATVPSLNTNVNVVSWLGTAVTSNAGTPIVYVSAGTVTTVSGNVSGNVVGSVGSVIGAVGSVTGTVTATVPGLNTNVNVVQWLGTAVTSNAGVPLVDVNAITGTVTATVVGGTIATVTNPVTLSTGQLTVKKNTALNGFTFPMYDASTGNPATGLVVSATVSVDGASLVSTVNSPSEVGSGIYKLNLAAADVNGTVITLVFVASSASATIVTLITQA